MSGLLANINDVPSWLLVTALVVGALGTVILVWKKPSGPPRRLGITSLPRIGEVGDAIPTPSTQRLGQSVSADSYLGTVRARLRRGRFREQSPPEGVALKAWRRELTRGGVANTVMLIRNAGLGTTTPTDISAFCDIAISSVSQGTSWLLRGLLSNAIVHSVIITNGIPDDLGAFVESYAPGRRGITTVCTLVDLGSKRLVTSNRKTLLGRFSLYEQARQEAHQLLTPTD